MNPLKDLHASSISVLLTDIDGTLTHDGRLPADAYESLEELSRSGISVVPVTGRPAGWCELIARLWPVHGVVGENGAFYFRYDKKMRRFFARPRAERKLDRKKLQAIRKEVLEKIPGTEVASDQFCRLFDLAIDFAEDVLPLSKNEILNIVKIFEAHGATAKVSNIHVNGWYGDHDKVSTCKTYLQREFGFDLKTMKSECAFIGDSPNDEPMFEFFPNSVAVANISEYLNDLRFKPAFIARGQESQGFCELASHLLVSRV